MARRPSGAATTGARAKPGIVELGVGAGRRPRRAPAPRRAQRVVALEPVLVDDRVHRAAALAAELARARRASIVPRGTGSPQ